MKHIGTLRYETERLILRPFTEEDAEAVFNNWASDEEVVKYLSWPAHKSVDGSRGYMKYCVQGYAQENFYQWGIELKDTHTLIGNISIVNIYEDTDRLEFGWVIGKRFWGKGYTAEAASKLLDVLFDEIGANCVCARHDVDNPSSGRVMEKIGMKYEGVLRQSGRNNQGIRDCAHYSILKSERKGTTE